MSNQNLGRRRFLRKVGVLGIAGSAGCTGTFEDKTVTPPEVESSSEVPPLVEDTPTQTETTATTFQPKKIARHDLDIVTVTDQLERDDEEIDVYENTSQRVFETCLQRYVYDTSRVNEDQETIWAHNNRLQVAVQPGDTVQGLTAAYNEGYAPPSKPYKPALLSDHEIIEGEETADGIRLSFPVDGEIRNLVGWFGEFESQGNGEVVIPYESLDPTYLDQPLYKLRAATATAEQTFYVQLPYPDVSFEVAEIHTNDDGGGLQLTEMTAEVTIESPKPTHLVNLHTDFGYPESFDYGYSIDADDFVEIEPGEPTELTRQFTDPPNSITDGDFRIAFPIEREEFTVVLGKIAPLASRTVSRDRFLE
ncbi:hypothetical protein LPA44_14415 [Halobacterium sp. KA-4]|uniref:hypothetical protein n=1 Tax=Halobacterium sp. KA-4 TaxID=2896367 RepID=UPI001E2F4841|nr:hypothetical protein [Halobacterium sp. KA-4]MCD2201076.1 hypothetical protein [Halobacterium sp. KA-4]